MKVSMGKIRREVNFMDWGIYFMRLKMSLFFYLLSSAVFAEPKEVRLELDRSNSRYLGSWYSVSASLKDEDGAVPILSFKWGPTGELVGTCPLKFTLKTRARWIFESDSNCDFTFLNGGKTPTSLRFTYLPYEKAEIGYTFEAKVELFVRSSAKYGLYHSEETDPSHWRCQVVTGGRVENCQLDDVKIWEKFGQ